MRDATALANAAVLALVLTLQTTSVVAEAASPANAPAPVGTACELNSAGVAHAQRLRAAVGLPASKADVEFSLARPDYSCADAGIPLSDSEAQTYRAVLNAQAELSDLVPALADDPGFGGAYLDGATLTVVSMDGTLGQILDPKLGTIRLIRGDFSQAELDQVANELKKDIDAQVLDFTFSYVAIDPRSNRIEVGVPDDVEGVDALLGKKYGDIISVVPAPLVEGDLFVCTVNNCGTKGGLAITNLGVVCMSAFLVRARVNNSGDPWVRYMLTAGHCVFDTGGVGGTNTWRNISNTVTWGTNQVEGFHQYDCGSWLKCIDGDAGLFAFGGNLPATRNSYFGPAGGVVSITGFKSRANQVVGQIVSRESPYTGFESGPILRKPLYERVTCQFPYTCQANYPIVVDMGSQHGDSGSGFVRKYSIFSTDYYDAYGILSGGSTDGAITFYYDATILHGDPPVGGLWDLEPCTTATCPLSP